MIVSGLKLVKIARRLDLCRCGGEGRGREGGVIKGIYNFFADTSLSLTH